MVHRELANSIWDEISVFPRVKIEVQNCPFDQAQNVEKQGEMLAFHRQREKQRNVEKVPDSEKVEILKGQISQCDTSSGWR